METKNPTEMVLKELQFLFPENFHAVAPHTPGGGGLFLTWKKEIELTILSSTSNYINTHIVNKGISFQTTFVYGEPDHSKRWEVWNKLTQLQPPAGQPWCLTGDFNEIVNNDEKCGGPCRAEGTFVAFRTFLSSNDLYDLKHHGSFLSWRGKRGTHLVQCRLDRAISNSSWSDLFPSCRSQYLKYEASDHRPLLSFLDTTKRKGTRIFRYDRRLKENQEVKAIIQDTWAKFAYLQVEERLTQCRRAICKWSKAACEKSNELLTRLRSQLDQAMSDPTPNDSWIHELNVNLLEAYKQEEAFWK